MSENGLQVLHQGPVLCAIESHKTYVTAEKHLVDATECQYAREIVMSSEFVRELFPKWEVWDDPDLGRVRMGDAGFFGLESGWGIRCHCGSNDILVDERDFILPQARSIRQIIVPPGWLTDRCRMSIPQFRCTRSNDMLHPGSGDVYDCFAEERIEEWPCWSGWGCREQCRT
jgi:hypothetical protein